MFVSVPSMRADATFTKNVKYAKLCDPELEVLWGQPEVRFYPFEGLFLLCLSRGYQTIFRW